MQKILNQILNRKVSTERVTNMPSAIAVSALDQRVQQLLALQALKPLPRRRTFGDLSNPIQKPQEV
jgi:hypothetical protein